MVNRYKEFKILNLPSIESEILEKWGQEQTFEKSISIREGAEPFVFYEGPPSANGMPGIHHVISRTLKDLVCRYKTMQGFKVQRKGGWDTHGLPVELGVEKELGITKEDIGRKISVEEYNQKCREAVVRYKDKWDELTMKMGYWVDLKHPYITFSNEYIETLWWCLKQLYEKGLLYKSVSIQPYSPAAGTGLSSHELNQPGTYKMVKDTSATVEFKIIENDISKFLFEAIQKNTSPYGDAFLLAWTTTPWTLPSNLGLTVGANIDYVLVKTFNPYTHETQNVILAKALLGKYFKPEGANGDFEKYSEKEKTVPWEILTNFKGKELEGIEYEQLLPSKANSLEAIKAITPKAKPFRILLGDFVTTEDGTGIVHTAPAFGADDFRIGKKYGIGILTLVDREGKFVEGVGEFSGRYIKDYKNAKDYIDVNVDISVKLKKEGRAFKVEKYEHSYPHCWRTDKPVVYYPLDAWFIKTTAVSDRMIELNKTINWKPASTGTGRFGNWLENMVDWNLSRSRYWGTPLPIWRTQDGREEKCIGSIDELNAEIKKASDILGGEVNKHYLHNGILDLHKPFVDEVILVSESGIPMHREPELIDVWFDSGAMPYAQWGLPSTPSGGKEVVTPELMLRWIMKNEGKISSEEYEEYVKKYEHDSDKSSAIQDYVSPSNDWDGASFIAEGVDQTRGWFYTLHALGVMLFDSVAYRNVVSNGLVLDKNGNKMSKRLGNVVDPFSTIEKFGADATRWYLITNAAPWDNLKFDLEGIKEVQRKFFGTLYNTYQFFALYANVDGFSFKEKYIPVADRPEIDRWILSALQTLIKKVTGAFDDYEPTQAGRLIEDFVDQQLSNWYVRLCRRRFWKGEYEEDKIAAYQTLYECLETIVCLMAPISPFFSDELFTNLNNVSSRNNVNSVHHALYPKHNDQLTDELLEARMQMAQEASSLILSLRKKANLKVRQPLQRALIPVVNNEMQNQLEKVEDLIKTEVNIKKIEYLRDTGGFIQKKIKPNFQSLGKKLGSKMKDVSLLLSGFSQQEILKLENEGKTLISLQGSEIELGLADVEIVSEEIPGWTVASKGVITVALDINITQELLDEGHARELVNRLQKIRKDSGLEVTDRVEVKIEGPESIIKALAKYNSYICAEILADELLFTDKIWQGQDIEINNNLLKVSILKKV